MAKLKACCARARFSVGPNGREPILRLQCSELFDCAGGSASVRKRCGIICAEPQQRRQKKLFLQNVLNVRIRIDGIAHGEYVPAAVADRRRKPEAQFNKSPGKSRLNL
ncbi:MAG: hypothetical protein U0872_00305 [Planctomycetaceae bacterium]